MFFFSPPRGDPPHGLKLLGEQHPETLASAAGLSYALRDSGCICQALVGNKLQGISLLPWTAVATQNSQEFSIDELGEPLHLGSSCAVVKRYERSSPSDIDLTSWMARDSSTCPLYLFFPQKF